MYYKQFADVNFKKKFEGTRMDHEKTLNALFWRYCEVQRVITFPLAADWQII